MLETSLGTIIPVKPEPRKVKGFTQQMMELEFQALTPKLTSLNQAL